MNQKPLEYTQLHPRFGSDNYVDDTFVVMDGGMVDRLLQFLNSMRSNIMFTIEKELENSLAFLDVNITRQPDGSTSTSVYGKPTHTDQYLHYSSHHPLCCKLGVVRALTKQARVLSSDDASLQQEFQHLGGALRDNGYPQHVFKRGLGVLPSVRPTKDIDVEEKERKCL